MKPVIAGNKPVKATLEKGQDYYICTCGRSGKQPYCDGSHKGSEFKPRRLTAEKDEQAWLCQCKHSRNFPYCDGSHKQFDDAQTGKEGPEV